MFDVGGPELILIVLAIIVLFGPKKMPEIAQMFTKGMRQVRKAQAQFQSQLNEIQSELKDATDIDFDDTKVIKVRPDNSKARDQVELDESPNSESKGFKVKEPNSNNDPIQDIPEREISTTNKKPQDNSQM